MILTVDTVLVKTQFSLRDRIEMPFLQIRTITNEIPDQTEWMPCSQSVQSIYRIFRLLRVRDFTSRQNRSLSFSHLDRFRRRESLSVLRSLVKMIIALLFSVCVMKCVQRREGKETEQTEKKKSRRQEMQQATSDHRLGYDTRLNYTGGESVTLTASFPLLAFYVSKFWVSTTCHHRPSNVDREKEAKMNKIIELIMCLEASAGEIKMCNKCKGPSLGRRVSYQSCVARVKPQTLLILMYLLSEKRASDQTRGVEYRWTNTHQFNQSHHQLWFEGRIGEVKERENREKEQMQSDPHPMMKWEKWDRNIIHTVVLFIPCNWLTVLPGSELFARCCSWCLSQGLQNHKRVCREI